MAAFCKTQIPMHIVLRGDGDVPIEPPSKDGLLGDISMRLLPEAVNILAWGERCSSRHCLITPAPPLPRRNAACHRISPYNLTVAGWRVNSVFPFGNKCELRVKCSGERGSRTLVTLEWNHLVTSFYPSNFFDLSAVLQQIGKRSRQFHIPSSLSVSTEMWNSGNLY